MRTLRCASMPLTDSLGPTCLPHLSDLSTTAYTSNIAGWRVRAGILRKWFLDKTGHKGLNNLLAAYEDKSAYSQCVFAYSRGPGDAPRVFVGRCPVCALLSGYFAYLCLPRTTCAFLAHFFLYLFSSMCNLFSLDTMDVLGSARRVKLCPQEVRWTLAGTPYFSPTALIKRELSSDPLLTLYVLSFLLKLLAFSSAYGCIW